jgi:cellulose synthase/poly-beta-1,6-N-acetylglucosamine synthase-like glycosyltransferase
MRILVVADNCTDDTADCARQAGHKVIERKDEHQRGKAFALAFAAAELETDAPDVVVIIDADCEIDAVSLSALIDEAANSGRPCQAVNLLRPCLMGSPLVQISTFAFFVKNSVRQRGLQRLAGRAHLTGTGMALPYSLFQRFGEVGDSVVEDLAFGIKLAQSGHPTILIDRATVWSNGSTEDGTLVQRRRWEGGSLSLSMRRGCDLVRRGLARFEIRSMFAGMDLLIPPLALFAAVNLLVLITSTTIAFAFDLGWWPIVFHIITLSIAFAAIGAVWLGEGRKFLSGSALLRVPLYVLWKMPLYFAVVRRGAPRDWLRSGR